MRAHSPLDPKLDTSTEAMLGQMSEFRSISLMYPSSFVQSEPVSVVMRFEFEVVVDSTKQNPPG
jgi:hypothetical protein